MNKMEKKINFEKEMNRLDEIISKLSSSSNLDDSIKLYQEGKEIIELLNTAINESKEQIEEIIK